jgi:hypothetical protein
MPGISISTVVSQRPAFCGEAAASGSATTAAAANSTIFFIDFLR